MAVTSMAESSIKNSRKFKNISCAFGAAPYNCEYVVVGGGSAGGQGQSISYGEGAGGGGAGGYRSNVPGESSGGGSSAQSILSLSPGTYSVIIGAGGSTGPNFGGTGTLSEFANIVSNPGGAGAHYGNQGGNGASGGGSGPRNLGTSSGTAGQGYGGGPASDPSSHGGGGGGGAGSAGIAAYATPTGGDGLTTNITGSALDLAGGGNAGGYYPGLGSGYGRGMGGGSNPLVSAVAAFANTGGGGGGGGQGATPNGSNGGSGIVIFRLPLQAPEPTFSGGVTHSKSTTGNWQVYTITATSTTSETVTFA